MFIYQKTFYILLEGIRPTTLLQQEDVDDFVDEEITITVKIEELRANNSLIKLSVKGALIFNYTIRDTERTKPLDIITQNIAVPSRRRSNLRLKRAGYSIHYNEFIYR